MLSKKNIGLTLIDIKSSLSKEDLKKLTIMDRYVLRKISFYVSFILYKYLNLSANAVSLLSILIVLLYGFIVILIQPQSLTTPLMLLLVWAILDCADGNLARALKKKYGISNEYGEFFDALSGYFTLATLWITVGYFLSINLSNIDYLLLGAVSSALALLSRMINLRFIILDNSLGTKKSLPSKGTYVYWLFENLEIGSFAIPILMIFSIYNILEYSLLFYLALNSASTLYGLLMLIMKAK